MSTATLSKKELLERAESLDVEVQESGGGWYVVAGEKVRGLAALEEALEDASGDHDAPTRCLCGCGAEVSGRFAQGHDAKLKSVLLKVARHEAGPPAIPEEALPHLEELDSLLGQHEESIQDVLEVVRAAG
jgi:hypothetical protein